MWFLVLVLVLFLLWLNVSFGRLGISRLFFGFGSFSCGVLFAR